MEHMICKNKLSSFCIIKKDLCVRTNFNCFVRRSQNLIFEIFNSHMFKFLDFGNLQQIKILQRQSVFKNLIVRRILGVFCIVFLGSLLACQPIVLKKDLDDTLKRLKKSDYPVFADDLGYKDLSLSIDQSLKYFNRVPVSRNYKYGKDIYNKKHLIKSLKTFKEFLGSKPSNKELKKFIKTRFIVYKAMGNEDKKVLFTGYFEPTYKGCLKKTPNCRYPLYSIPDDMFRVDLSKFSGKYKNHKDLMARVIDEKKQIIPYYSREQINLLKEFHKKAKPLIWLESRIDRFFLEIQGSGRVIVNNLESSEAIKASEKILRVQYAASNGRPYSSIGRYLIRKNEILKENMSMQAIKDWLKKNPERIDEVLYQNQSFVFFKQENRKPHGSIGVEVTALRSIATDSRLFPKAGLGFVQSYLPDPFIFKTQKKLKKHSFFVLNQDTGGAIKGPARADLFCGNGDYAEFTAGHMNQYGQLFFLVLKPDSN